MQHYVYLFVSAFMALFPVINPVSSAFMINGFINNLNDADRKTAIKKITIYSLMIGIGSLLLGHIALLLFGLAIPIIQFGGGILICKTGIEMLSDSKSNNDNSELNKTIKKITLADIDKKLFYPITFPITIGAGAMSIIFTLMANAWVKDNLLETTLNYSVISMVIIIMCIIVWILLWQGYRIMEKISSSANLIINKLVAFFTFCVGLQIMFTGISKIFHINIL